jgi:hypothetical protein
LSILEGYITEQELADQLGRKRSTVERWRRLKIGPPFVRNGKTPLYHIESSQAWLRSGGVRPRQSRKPQRTLHRHISESRPTTA